MKDKVLTILKSKTLFALIINIAVMLFVVSVTSFSYDSSDDFYNSLYICQYHYYYSSEINYIFATIVGSLQYVLPNFNCFVLSQILLSCAAFSTITFVFADKFGKAKSLVLSLFVSILFAFDHYSYILSSKTSALLLTAGVLVVLNSIRNKRYSLSFWVGLLEILFGTFICFKYFFVALAFFAAYFAADMISKRKYRLRFRKFFWYFRPFALVFAFIVLLGLGLEYYSYSVNNSTAEAADYYRYSSLSNYGNDNAFPNYSYCSDEMNAVGISSVSEYELLIDGYYDPDNGLNTDALETAANLQKQNNPFNFIDEMSSLFADLWEHTASFDSYLIVYIMTLMIMIAHVTIHKKRFAFFSAFYFITGFAACMFIRFAMASSAYTMYGVLLMMMSFALYSYDFDHLKSKNLMPMLHKNIKVALAAAVFLVLICSFSITAYYVHYKPIDYSEKPSDLYTEVGRHPENYYILDPVTAREYISYTDYYTHPLWGFSSNFLSNIDGFGYHNKQSQLVSRNLPTNIYEAVVDGRKVYVIDKSITFTKEKYLNLYYGNDESIISYNKVKEFNGYTIYSVDRG